MLSVMQFLFCVLGPFTRPHPAIWRIVFGEFSSVFRVIHGSLSPLRFPFLTQRLYCRSDARSERALLPVPCFHHLPQLAAGEAAYVLAGPKSALRQERGGYYGER